MTEKKQKELEKKVGLDYYNDLLKKEGVRARIAVGDDGEGFYEMSVKDGNNVTPVSCGLNEDELADEIITCYYEMVRDKYVVTYVALSDNEPDGNGYCEVKICSERNVAERVLKDWLAAEVAEHDDVHVTNDNDKSIISWAGGAESVIISIHKKRVNWV